MNRSNKNFKLDSKTKTKNSKYNYFDEEQVTIKDIKRDKEQKKYRNFSNVLRSKNIDALLDYEEE